MNDGMCGFRKSKCFLAICLDSLASGLASESKHIAKKHFDF